MAIETEAKLRVESHEPVRRRLRDSNAIPLGRVLEFNRIFDRADGTLRAGGCGLRVRSATSDQGEVVSTLTLKGPVMSGPVKSREEFEVKVSDADEVSRILEKLGFVTILAFEKRRESWRLGECRIELDEPPHLGLFVEIEGPDVETIRAVQAALDLMEIPHEPASYVRMLSAYCAAHGITDRTLRCV